MAKNKKPSTLYSVIFMFLLAALFTGILAGLNILTADAIATNSVIDKQRAILRAANVKAEDAEIQGIFEKDFELVSDQPREVYLYKGQEGPGYVFAYQGGALWGNVLGYAGINPEMDKLLGMSVYQNAETPGLGGRITEDWYQDQFVGLPVKDGEFIIYKPSPGGNVDAISGATLTSNSMKDMLNEEIQAFREEAQGGKYEQ